MTTFSQMVDSLVLETRRPDMRSEICTYLNQTIREAHFDPSSGGAVFYSENYRETQITIDSLSGQNWQVPNPTLFQSESAVRFDGVFMRDSRQVYAQRVEPGPRMAQEPYSYYRAGTIFIFGGISGYGAIGSTISIAYFEYPRGLKYHEVASRPASYDLEAGWTYADEYDTTDEQRQLAQDLSTNWLLTRWYMVIEEGLRAKVYKRLSDQQRAATCYSMYMKLRQGLMTSEIADVTGFW